jgi:transcription elongation factor GreA
LISQSGPSLSEALTRFIASKKGGKKAQDGHIELGRFVAWCGRQRSVNDVSPAEVAEYAQHIGLGGVDSALRLNPLKPFLAYLKDEGWIVNGLAAHLRVPRTRKTTGSRSSSSGAYDDATHLSQEGYDRLVAQVAVLKGERVSIVEDIRRAMEDKDFRENAPLEAAKERQGIIESKIRELEAGLVSAVVMQTGRRTAQQKAVVGAKLTLKDMNSGKKVVYTLVDVREADASSGKISTVSPVGSALMSRSVGEEIAINVPKGTLKYTIEKIST